MEKGYPNKEFRRELLQGDETKDRIGYFANPLPYSNYAGISLDRARPGQVTRKIV